MAVFHPYTVKCSCGKSFEAALARSVNATRSPQLRQAIVDGTFHRFRCPHCQREGTIEKAFNYIDPSRRTVIRVQPRQERESWRQASQALERDAERVPEGVIARKQRHMRVVFGLSELREKLIAQDAGIDDRVAELLKVFVVQDHPFLTQRPRLRMAFTAADESTTTFMASFDHGTEAFRCSLPRNRVADILDNPAKAAQWSKKAHKKQSIFELDRDYWINMWRWSPQPGALALLREFAARIRNNKPVNTNSADFKRMLRDLPRGKNLPANAKGDLQELFNYAKRKKLAKLQDTLFEIRFGIALDDDWAQNDDPNDIDTLWMLLKNLPQASVEGNVALDQINLAEGEGGGWYEPWSHDIYIGSGELGQQERFEDVIRHEVGHAVHEMLANEIDGWLKQKFGWETFEPDPGGVDDWIARMGGWGHLTPAQRDDVRGYLIAALGPGSKWMPGPAPNAAQGHPWLAADFGPRLAYEKTGANWYENNAAWYRANGKAFFLNYWYRKFMVVDAAALALIEKMPDAYAAMSPFEFFAEVYALYYDLDDPLRPNLPRDVVEWMDAKIGSLETNSPNALGLTPAHRSGGRRIRRPALPARTSGARPGRRH